MSPVSKLVPAVLLAAAVSLAAQTIPHFYDVDKEIKVEGTVKLVRFEPRYENTAPFLVVLLEEKSSGRTFQVEISPAWFFEIDIHESEPMRVVGSLVSGSAEGGAAALIAREIRCRGETIVVRDRRGFPSWRGGPMRHRKKGPGI